MRTWLQDRLRELKPQGKSKGGLAIALGLTAPRISEIIFERRAILSHEITPMAEYLLWTRDELLEHMDSDVPRAAERPAAGVMVIGAVQAGKFSEAIEWPRNKWFPAPLAADQRYAQYPQFALQVIGPSINQLYPDGSIIVCVRFMDLGRNPEQSELVVVERRRLADDQHEATVKEIRVADDGSYWLWPRSTDPAFQQPWKLEGDEAGVENDDLVVKALVIGGYRAE